MRGILSRIFVDSPITTRQRHSKIIPIFPTLRNCILNIIKRRLMSRHHKIMFFRIGREMDEKTKRVKFNNFSLKTNISFFVIINQIIFNYMPRLVYI